MPRNFDGNAKQGRLRRTLLVAVALMAYTLSTVPIPLPVSFSKQRGVDYPCREHACGCNSARECWEHCCCYTPRQKLAWAREHQVEPPRELVEQLAAVDHEELAAAEQEHCHACASRESSCCARRAADVAAPACGCNHPAQATKTPASRLKLFYGVEARKCRGLSNLWTISGAVSAAPAVVVWHFQWNVVEWLELCPARDYLHDSTPPVPPPKV